MAITKMSRDELIQLLWAKRNEGICIDFIDEFDSMMDGITEDDPIWNHVAKMHAEIFTFDGCMTLVITGCHTNRYRGSFVYRFKSWLTPEDEARVSEKAREKARFTDFTKAIEKFFNYYVIRDNVQFFVKGEIK